MLPRDTGERRSAMTGQFYASSKWDSPLSHNYFGGETSHALHSDLTVVRNLTGGQLSVDTVSQALEDAGES